MNVLIRGESTPPNLMSWRGDLDVIPSAGDHVIVGPNQTTEVKAVVWEFSNDGQARVQIILDE